jgi:DNA-binding NarL/FixJ family response regulator
VILTSSNEERDRIASYKLGVNSYVVKPVDFDDFARAVAEIGCYWVLTNKPPY